jgi:hypothetical protein
MLGHTWAAILSVNEGVSNQTGEEVKEMSSGEAPKRRIAEGCATKEISCNLSEQFRAYTSRMLA